MSIILHPIVKKRLDLFIGDPAQGLLLVGPTGSGKGTLAAHISATLLDTSMDKLSDHPYVFWLRDQEKGISIESVREAINFVQLKTPGKQKVRRVIIIEQGETMSREAQNAFLKLLEEPPADTLIITTVTGVEKVLPTIRSRMQIVDVQPPSLDQIINFHSSTYSVPAITKAYHISEGHVGLISALLANDQDHPLLSAIDQAKNIMSSSLFDRLKIVDELSKNKQIGLLLQAMERVCHAALIQSANKGSDKTKRWASRLKAVVKAEDEYSNKAQPKLLLTNLMLNL